MSLLYPLGLLALAAWLVPLLVHLARRQQHTPLDFAALRWLRMAVRPRRQIRLDEWPLLLLRLLLLALLALLLAQPVLPAAKGPAGPWHVVAPGLDAAALRAQQADGHWHWLAPGFPGLDDPPPAATQPLASLLRELDQQLPAGTALTVYVPEPMPGLDGQRLQLSRAVNWQPVARALPTQAPPASPPRLQPGGAGSEAVLPLLAALQRAWTDTDLLPVRAGDPPPGNGDLGVWLSPDPLPVAWQHWLQSGGRVLLVDSAASDGPGWRLLLADGQGQAVLLQRTVGKGQLLRFAASPQPARLPLLAEAGFPRQLLRALQPVPTPSLAPAQDQQPASGAGAPSPPARELASWLLLLICVVFAIERLLATRVRRRSAP